ncbi:MAG: GDP-L-fucose synthase [Sediminibacterium sp.]|nr:GDP-L-fucose synthase [Sediminibacterium sp.]
MNLTDKIYVAGHRGLVGSAIVRFLLARGFTNLICKTRQELDLRDPYKVENFFLKYQPDYVFDAAAKVGGIYANNTYPAEFIYNNLQIQNNLIHSSYVFRVKKLLFLGSSCIYPKFATQPIKEDYLLDGKLEPTNEAYAIAKIAGVKMCEFYNKQFHTNFISAMPTNLYGPNDNYDLANSHVLPALLRKTITAKKYNLPNIQIWGTGSPRREFLHVDDLAEACVFLMQRYNEAGLVNVGCGEDISILELAKLIAQIVGFEGSITTNPAQPDGTPRKLLDISKLHALGWKHRIALPAGIEQVLDDVKDVTWPKPE